MAFGTKTGTVRGQVLDNGTSSPIPGAWVTDQGSGLGAQTDKQGVYEIDDVPCGRSVIVATDDYHFTGVTSNVAIRVQHDAVIDFRLKSSLVLTQAVRPMVIRTQVSGRPDPFSGWARGHNMNRRWPPYTADLKWAAVYEGPRESQGHDLRPTSDNGYIVVGQATDHVWDESAYLLKLDSLGNKQWDRVLGGGVMATSNAVQPSSDGYVLTGLGTMGGCVTRTDSQGAVLWERAVSSGFERAWPILAPTLDGSLVAETGRHLVKMDSMGEIQWISQLSARVGVSEWLPDHRAVRQTRDGGYLAQAAPAHFVRFDPEGKLLVAHTLPNARGVMGSSFNLTNDGGFVVACNGVRRPRNSASAVSLVKFSASGRLQWNRSLPDTLFGSSTCVLQCRDGNYAVCGSTASDKRGTRFGEVVFLDSLAAPLCSVVLRDVGVISDVESTRDGGIIITGTIVRAGKELLFVMKLSTAHENYVGYL